MHKLSGLSCNFFPSITDLFKNNCRSTSFHCSALYTCDSEEEEGYSLDTLANDKLGNAANKPVQLSTSAPATVTCSNLLGSFEECVLNGRLEPVSTVQGFTAEIAASGAFCPKRTTKPVTVFFYTLCDNDQISSPYMVSYLRIENNCLVFAYFQVFFIRFFQFASQ